jgi:peptide/nickel transport system substrate-binding protein
MRSEGSNERGHWSRVCIALAVLAVPAVVAGCGGGSNNDSSSSAAKTAVATVSADEVSTAEKFTIAVPYDINVLDPMSGENIADLMLFGNVNETLVVPEFPDGKVAAPKIAPALATSWEQKNDTTW